MTGEVKKRASNSEESRGKKCVRKQREERDSGATELPSATEPEHQGGQRAKQRREEGSMELLLISAARQQSTEH